MRTRCYKVTVSALRFDEISCGVRSYSHPGDRSYSAASVYITEPAQPVLMWSCASAELSRKIQTSEEAESRREPRRALPVFQVAVQQQGDPRSDLAFMPQPAGTTESLLV